LIGDAAAGVQGGHPVHRRVGARCEDIGKRKGAAAGRGLRAGRWSVVITMGEGDRWNDRADLGSCHRDHRPDRIRADTRQRGRAWSSALDH
jgi:hypothetical protein